MTRALKELIMVYCIGCNRCMQGLGLVFVSVMRSLHQCVTFRHVWGSCAGCFKSEIWNWKELLAGGRKLNEVSLERVHLPYKD